MNEPNNNGGMKFIGPNQGGENTNVTQPVTLAGVVNTIPQEPVAAAPNPAPAPVPEEVVAPTPTVEVANTASETPAEQVEPAAPAPLTLGTVVANTNPAPTAEVASPQAPAEAPAPAPAPAEPTVDANSPQQVTDNNALPPSEEKPKKKMSPIVIIALALLLLVIGVGLLYYFVLSTPKKMFTHAFDSFSKQLNTTAPSNLKYTTINLGGSLSTENETYKQYGDLISKVKINATYGESDNKYALNGMVTYDDKELLNLNLLLDENAIYVKANNILNKVLKITLKEDSSIPDVDIKDYEQIKKSLLNAIDKALDKGNYKKELVTLDGSRAVKSTLKIDGPFAEEIYNILSKDTAFLDSCAKVSGEEVSKITEEMKKELDEYKDKSEEVAIYTTLLKNELLKLVYTSDKEEFTLKPSGNNYNYEIKEENKTTYKGYVKYKNVGTNSTLIFNIEIPEEKTTALISLNTLAVDSLDVLDITGATDADKLTEEDTNELIGNLFKNEAVKTLLNDLGMKESDVAGLIAE